MEHDLDVVKIIGDLVEHAFANRVSGLPSQARSLSSGEVRQPFNASTFPGSLKEVGRIPLQVFGLLPSRVQADYLDLLLHGFDAELIELFPEVLSHRERLTLEDVRGALRPYEEIWRTGLPQGLGLGLGPILK